LSDLGKKLRELRLEQRLTQREAARRLGISHTRLTDYESGITHGRNTPAIPNREMLAKMAHLYGFPLDMLLALAGLPAVEPPRPPLPSTVEADAQEAAEICRRLPDDRRRVFMGVVRAFKADMVQ
jgi:transcriptional regulator with XRE-family HTH domain